MNTTRVNTCTCTTKKNAARDEVWACFEKYRGLGAVLMDSSDGWSYVCVPAAAQPEWDENLKFLEMDFVGAEGEVPFVGGWVGYMSYDLGLEWLGFESTHNLAIPKMQWRFCDKVYAFHVSDESLSSGGEFELGGLRPGISDEEYFDAIRAIHEYLKNGDSYQVNFARDFTADFEGDPFDLYKALFMANPADMSFFMEAKGFALCSNSPERLFSLKDGKLRAEPIKGTVGRNEDPSFLLEDEKSEAELTMIVDLLRNDLGRVAKMGSVRVPEHRAIMELSHVYHTYSAVEADLLEGKSVRDVLQAVFPGGSVTGCPKKRTMKIIDELESFSRGAYCGSAGYVSVNGNADFNIMIRTATVQNGQMLFPAGGGIVIDSNAASELEETQKKSEVLRELSCFSNPKEGK